MLALAIFGGWRLWTADDQETDDAMVDADVVSLTARTAGVVKEVRVHENAAVNAGDVLVVLDDAELAARVRQAEAAAAAAQAQADAADAQAQVAEAAAHGGLATATAQVSTSRAQLAAAEAQVASAEAQLARAETEAGRAARDDERLSTLVKAGGGTAQSADSAHAAHLAAESALLAARAQLDAAREGRTAAASRVAEAGGALDTNSPVDARIAAAHANAALAHANLDAANAALDLARISLSYATITAPIAGTVTRVAARVGQSLSPGSPVASVVPNTSFVVANFKETQVADMHPGEPVDIAVDTWPGRTFHGVVASVAPGTGSRFSLLAPDNASGNFVKVVQRVPVRIDWADLPSDVTPRPGQSAVVTVHTGR